MFARVADVVITRSMTDRNWDRLAAVSWMRIGELLSQGAITEALYVRQYLEIATEHLQTNWVLYSLRKILSTIPHFTRRLTAVGVNSEQFKINSNLVSKSSS
jgi:hypothetical protein